MPRGFADPFQPLDQLVRKTLDGQLVAGMERHHRADAVRRQRTAQKPVRFDDQRLGSRFGRGDGRHGPRDAAAHHDYVILLHV